MIGFFTQSFVLLAIGRDHYQFFPKISVDLFDVNCDYTGVGKWNSLRRTYNVKFQAESRRWPSLLLFDFLDIFFTMIVKEYPTYYRRDFSKIKMVLYICTDFSTDLSDTFSIKLLRTGIRKIFWSIQLSQMCRG